MINHRQFNPFAPTGMFKSHLTFPLLEATVWCLKGVTTVWDIEVPSTNGKNRMSGIEVCAVSPHSVSCQQKWLV